MWCGTHYVSRKPLSTSHGSTSPNSYEACASPGVALAVDGGDGEAAERQGVALLDGLGHTRHVLIGAAHHLHLGEGRQLGVARAVVRVPVRAQRLDTQEADTHEATAAR